MDGPFMNYEMGISKHRRMIEKKNFFMKTLSYVKSRWLNIKFLTAVIQLRSK